MFIHAFKIWPVIRNYCR